MVSNRIGLAVIGGACVIAAGGGAFLATRYASGPSAPSTAVTAEVPSTAPQAVHETEAVLEAEPTPDAEAPDAATVRSDEARATTATPPLQSATKTVTSPRVPRKAAERPVTRRPRESARRTETTRPAPVSAPAAATEPVERSAETAPPSYVPTPLEPIELPRAAERQFEELVIPAESVIGLQLERTITSETARVEDRVEARVTRDVRVDGRVAVPAGSRVLGSVALVERGGKMKERARLGIRFHTLVLADGTSHAVQTDTVYREGESPAGSSAAKIGGGAIGGAILGAIIGGGKGAVIGGATGAGGGTAAVMAGSRRPATMSAGSTMTVRVLSPVTVTVEH